MLMHMSTSIPFSQAWPWKDNAFCQQLLLGLGADVWGCSPALPTEKVPGNHTNTGNCLLILYSSSSLTHCKCTQSPQNSEVLDNVAGFVILSNADWYIHNLTVLPSCQACNLTTQFLSNMQCQNSSILIPA